MPKVIFWWQKKLIANNFNELKYIRPNVEIFGEKINVAYMKQKKTVGCLMELNQIVRFDLYFMYNV